MRTAHTHPTIYALTAEWVGGWVGCSTPRSIASTSTTTSTSLADTSFPIYINLGDTRAHALLIACRIMFPDRASAPEERRPPQQRLSLFLLPAECITTHKEWQIYLFGTVKVSVKKTMRRALMRLFRGVVGRSDRYRDRGSCCTSCQLKRYRWNFAGICAAGTSV